MFKVAFASREPKLCWRNLLKSYSCYFIFAMASWCYGAPIARSQLSCRSLEIPCDGVFRPKLANDSGLQRIQFDIAEINLRPFRLDQDLSA